jgi:putative flippase GtrA
VVIRPDIWARWAGVAPDAYPGQVNLVRTLLDRWHRLIRELAKFGIIGLVNTVVEIAIFNLVQIAVLLGPAPLKAKVIATAVATTTSYFMNRHWTFRHRERSGLRREYVLFFMFNGIGLVLQLGLLAIAKYAFHLEDNLLWINIVNLFCIGISTLFRFWTYQTWVFRHPEDAIFEPEEGVLPEDPEDSSARAAADAH